MKTQKGSKMFKTTLATKAQVKALAKKYGATFTEDGMGYVYIDLPAGKVWDNTGEDSAQGECQFDESPQEFWGYLLGCISGGVRE